MINEYIIWEVGIELNSTSEAVARRFARERKSCNVQQRLIRNTSFQGKNLHLSCGGIS